MRLTFPGLVQTKCVLARTLTSKDMTARDFVCTSEEMYRSNFERLSI